MEKGEAGDKRSNHKKSPDKALHLHCKAGLANCRHELVRLCCKKVSAQRGDSGDNRIMRRIAALLALTVLSCAALATDSAADVMKQAYARAGKEHKNVLVLFHASWCGWCHRLDAFLDKQPEGKKVMDAYVVVHLDVLEQPEKADLENAGAEEMMKAWDGEKSGLPFMVVLDAKGKKLMDSNRVKGDQKTNTGYPAAPEEIGHFMTILSKTSKLSKNEQASIQKWLTDNAPKQ